MKFKKENRKKNKNMLTLKFTKREQEMGRAQAV